MEEVLVEVEKEALMEAVEAEEEETAGRDRLRHVPLRDVPHRVLRPVHDE